MPQRILRTFFVRIWSRHAKPARGFTIVEVMVAFAVVLAVLIGLTSALTASMQLNTTQKQRALAQDIVRDVVSTYVKNAPYDEINPFNVNAQTGACDNCSNVTEVIYDGSNGTDNLSNYTGLPSLLSEELANLQQPRLELLISPVKKTATAFYDTKINVLARLTWDGGGQRMVEMPSVVGMGDLTRTSRARFEKPEPTPTPSTQAQPMCTPLGEDPDATGLACCSPLIESSVTGLCAPDVNNPVCAEDGQNPSAAGFNGLCCVGATLDSGSGLCKEDIPSGPTCGAAGQAPVAGQCCTGLNAVQGLCKDCSGKLLPGASCNNTTHCNSNCCSGAFVGNGSTGRTCK